MLWDKVSLCIPDWPETLNLLPPTPGAGNTAVYHHAQLGTVFEEHFLRVTYYLCLTQLQQVVFPSHSHKHYLTSPARLWQNATMLKIFHLHEEGWHQRVSSQTPKGPPLQTKTAFYNIHLPPWSTPHLRCPAKMCLGLGNKAVSFSIGFLAKIMSPQDIHCVHRECSQKRKSFENFHFILLTHLTSQVQLN